MENQNRTSLIAVDKQQLTLNSLDMPDEVFHQEHQQGIYTGERLHRDRPQDYQRILSLRAEGLTISRIADMLHVHRKTVRAVISREPAAIAQEKERLAGVCMQASSMLVEDILDTADNPALMAEVSMKDKAITMAVLVDKAQLISGGPTSRIELSAGPDHDDFNALLTHYQAGKAGQKGIDHVPKAVPVSGETRIITVEATQTEVKGDA